MGLPNVVILDSVVLRKVSVDNGFSMTEGKLSGENSVTAIIEAVTDRYKIIADRTKLKEELEKKVASFEKVTVLKTGQNVFGAKSISAWSGKLFKNNDYRDDKYGLLPKGSRRKGIIMEFDEILDICEGYNQEDIFKDKVNKIQVNFPELKQLSRERLKQLPNPQQLELIDNTDNHKFPLVVFGTLRIAGEESPASLWLVDSYDPENDIASGCVVVPPHSQLFSEFGTIYGKQLCEFGSEVIDSPVLTATQLNELVSLDNSGYDKILKLITDGSNRNRVETLDEIEM